MVKNGEFDPPKLKNGTNYVSMTQIMCRWHKLCVDSTNYESPCLIL